MIKEFKYNESDRMYDLISENEMLLQVMTRFGLSLGFGDKTVREVCAHNSVDTHTFLTVINFVEEKYTRIEDDVELLSMPELMGYLKRSHTYFLDYRLPSIRSKLIGAIEKDQTEWGSLLLKFFDDYVSEVRKHMNYEDKTVFTFVDALLSGKGKQDYHITTYSQHHGPIDIKLTELKNIIIKYYPSKGNNELLNAALLDIFSCERELDSHCKIEDYIFVPAVLNLERRLTNANK